VCCRYNDALNGSPQFLAEHRLPNGEDGNAALCIAAASRKTVRLLFSHIHSLHLETYDEIVNVSEELSFDRKGKPVIDVPHTHARSNPMGRVSHCRARSCERARVC
jgi:hypothetical protein